MPINVFKLSSGGGGLLLVGGVPLSATLTAITDQFGNVSPLKIATASVQMVAPTFLTLPNWTNTFGSKDGFFASQSINVPSAGNGVFRMIRNDYTINNTAAQTGTVTGYFLNATETNLNGITHNLLDLQRNSVSQFKVNNFGALIMSGSLYMGSLIAFGGGSYSQISATTTDSILLRDSLGTSFGRLQFGGTTGAFPSLKRSGADLELKTADDLGWSYLSANGFVGITSIRSFGFGLFGTAGLIHPSAILQADSTNKGFLMPRMTETQINTIPSPADGLMVYNTTIQTPCFYNGLTMQWQKISHSIM